VEDMDQIKKVAEDFYRKLLGPSHAQFDERKARRVEMLILSRLPTDIIEWMENEVSVEEIKRTIFSMKCNKAPISNRNKNQKSKMLIRYVTKSFS
jgi:hypothetical protein